MLRCTALAGGLPVERDATQDQVCCGRCGTSATDVEQQALGVKTATERTQQVAFVKRLRMQPPSSVLREGSLAGACRRLLRQGLLADSNRV